MEQCPYGAIEAVDGHFVIDPAICQDCDDQGKRPLCVISCPQTLPQASQSRRGRGRLLARPAPETERLAVNHQKRFASCLPLWEAATLLSQGTDACQGDDPHLLIERQSQQVWMGLGLTAELRADAQGRWQSPRSTAMLPRDQALVALAGFDRRAVAMHLILAARVTAHQKPWAETIVLDDRYLEDILGLDRRRDLNRTERLGLLKLLMLQVVRLVLELRCDASGSLPAMALSNDPLWRLERLEHHFQGDELGQSHLAGLTFHLVAGGWSRYFLNAIDQPKKQALFQYGSMPETLPHAVMRHWQQHPGAVRLMVWLLFKLRLGQQHALLVQTLMRNAYGSERMQAAETDRELRKRLVRTYDSDLLVLLEEGLRPRFHPQLYPDEIRPLWHAMGAIPDDPEEALAYWAAEGASDHALGDQGPRNKYRRLLQARILGFDLDHRWRQGRGAKPARRSPSGGAPRDSNRLTPRQIQEARHRRGLSQRSLATLMQRSQSWVRDLESGRCRPTEADHARLRQVLEMDTH